MFEPIFPHPEVVYRQQLVRAGYIQAQRQFSRSGLRQIIGNTVIEIGSRIHGMAQSSCDEAARNREQLRTTLKINETDIQANTIH